MDSLLTDKRGCRKGFPTDVIAELGALDIYRHALGNAPQRRLGPTSADAISLYKGRR